MKHYLNCLLSVCIIFIFAACRKIDLHHFQNYYFPKNNVAKYWTDLNDPLYDKYDTLFSITYNKSTSYPEFINCSFYGVGSPIGPFLYHINYLPGEAIVSDNLKGSTALHVWLNKFHRPDSAHVFAPLGTDNRYRFIYDKGRLSDFQIANRLTGNIFVSLYLITYDANGNVIRMLGPTSEFGEYDTKYTYDYSVADKQQFYLDDVTDLLTPGFMLMRYLGMFYELQPHNQRIYVDETVNGYRAYYTDLTDHIYNKKGQLISYNNKLPTPLHMIWKNY